MDRYFTGYIYGVAGTGDPCYCDVKTGGLLSVCGYPKSRYQSGIHCNNLSCHCKKGAARISLKKAASVIVKRLVKYVQKITVHS